MTPHQVFDDLKSKIPLGMNLKEALVTFIKHFADTEIEGCSKANDGDMLLFQWGGPYSWDSYFSINLTRQFSHENEDGEYLGMQQLQMNCRYDADAVSTESGNEWFDGTDIESFTNRVLSSEAVAAVGGLEMRSLDFELDDV
jgi:hypothetical protein